MRRLTSGTERLYSTALITKGEEPEAGRRRKRRMSRDRREREVRREVGFVRVFVRRGSCGRGVSKPAYLRLLGAVV